MAIYNGPARGGTRGGKDLFDWEDVKEDKYNQNYLGHSVKAPVGRWQKNKDLNWYRKKSKFDLAAAQKAELEIAKEREKDLMAQMLGEKPMEAPKSDMTRIEKNKLYKRGNAEEGTVAAEIEADSFGERVEGLGYAPIKIDNLREQMDTTTHERQEGTAVNDLLKAHAEGHGDAGERHQHAGEEDQDHAALLAAIEAAGAFSPKNAQADPSDKKAMKKRLKKLEKEEKKRKKAEKKAAKRSKGDKEKSTRPRDDSDSRSSSEGRGREPSPAGREERRGGLEKGERGAGSRREEERRTELRRRSRSRSRSRDRDQRRDRDRSRSRSRGRERDRSRSGEERRHR